MAVISQDHRYATTQKITAILLALFPEVFYITHLEEQASEN